MHSHGAQRREIALLFLRIFLRARGLWHPFWPETTRDFLRCAVDRHGPRHSHGAQRREIALLRLQVSCQRRVYLLARALLAALSGDGDF